MLIGAETYMCMRLVPATDPAKRDGKRRGMNGTKKRHRQRAGMSVSDEKLGLTDN